jgi:hypothetical protein
MNALAAYQKGATGAGVNLAIIDSGIDTTSAEFGNRISSASQDVAGNSSIADQSGHGTAVAFTAAGRRNDAGTHGVAFDATLTILRADRPGTCASSAGSDSDESCKFSTDAIARGVDVARTAGARVINMSLGGAAMPQSLVAAIGRATAAGIVVVIAAGNDSTDNPDPFASVASDTATARNQVIIAGSVGTSDVISSFSDKAGTGAAQFLTAVGERVRAPDNTGTPYLWSGTSFAAPQIAGAVALLAQAFPNLTGAQIVDILFRTARDAGSPGVDAVYGNGVIDLTRAFQPVGTMSLAGSTAAISTASNATLSPAMGDANVGTLGAVILDDYHRAFAIDLAPTIRRAGTTPVLLGALQTGRQVMSVARGSLTAAFTLSARPNGDAVLARTMLSDHQATTARAIAGIVSQRLGSRTSYAIGFSQGAGTLAASLAGAAQPAFLVAGDGTAGIELRPRSSGAVRHLIGGIGLTGAAETGDVLWQRDPALAGMSGWRRSRYDRALLALDRRVGALSLGLTGSLLNERDTILGARFDLGFGAASAASAFVDARARTDLGAGWSLGGAWRQGWTHARIAGVGDGRGLLGTRAFAADLGKDGVLAGGDSIGLRLAQPLRVERGGVALSMPVYWDYASGAVTAWERQRLNLAPTGRELDVEMRYAAPLAIGLAETNLFWRRDPGNVAVLPPDYGAALRWSVGF